jgi:hypothetical protein
MLNDTDLSTPSAGWVRRVPLNADYVDEELTRRDILKMSRLHDRVELQRVLGALSLNTTILARLGGGVIGPAIDRHGRVLLWSVWAPQRGVLIDDFTRVPPSQEERDDRTRFASENGLRYAVIERGYTLTAKSVKEWLDGSDHSA